MGGGACVQAPLPPYEGPGGYPSGSAVIPDDVPFTRPSGRLHLPSDVTLCVARDSGIGR